MAWEDPDEHSFFVPPQARWSALQQTASNIGEALNLACAKLEEFNTDTLEGVLLAMDFNDPNKLGNTKNRDTVLGKLVQHFSRLKPASPSPGLSQPPDSGRCAGYPPARCLYSPYSREHAARVGSATLPPPKPSPKASI